MLVDANLTVSPFQFRDNAVIYIIATASLKDEKLGLAFEGDA